MLEISIDDKALELAPGASVNITSSSPIFDKDSIDRKFSLPFRLPLTPNNRRARKHSNRLDAGNKTTSVPSKVRFGGNLLLSGNMILNSVSDTQEEVSIANNPLKIWESLGKIKINEILESFDLLDGRPAPIWQFGMGFVGTYEFHIGTVDASATAPTFGDIPIAGASIESQINAVYPGIATYNVVSNRLEIDSFFIYENPGFSYTLFNLTQYENVALYNYHAVRDHVLATHATPIASHCFPMIKWNNFPGLYFYRIMNNVIDGVMVENDYITSPLALFWRNAILPCVRIPYILSKIGEALGGYVWGGDVWDDVDFQKLIHVPNLTLDDITEDVYDDLATHSKNTFKPAILLNNLVPAMSAAQFIQQLCTTFGLYLASSEGVLEFKKKQTPLQVKPLNLDRRIGKAYAIEPNTNAGWELRMIKSTNEIYTDPAQLNSVVTGEGEYLVETTTALFMKDSVLSGIHSHLIRCPYTDQPGHSPAHEPGVNKSTMPLTLLFCHELQPDSFGDNYLHASHDGLNYDGDTVGAYSLSPEGATGLYEQWHKSVIEFVNADGLTVTAYLHPGELQKLLEWEVGRIEFYHPEGTVTGAIKSIQALATSEGLKPTKLELLYR